MAVQINSYNNKNLNLPLTITPVLHTIKHHRPDPDMIQQQQQQPKQPDLTFHCMCCNEFYANPFHLYQHMNTNHTELSEQSNLPQKNGIANGSTDDDDDECDYSWVLEPVCELIDLDDGNKTINESQAEDTDSDSDDSDSDDDDDDSSSTSSSSNSSSTSSGSTTNTNSNTEQSANMLSITTNTNCETLPDGEVMEEAAYEEVEASSLTTTSNASTGIAPEYYQPSLRLETADPRESTSIILLHPNAGTTITPVKRRRGRRSIAPTINSLSSSETNEQKCFQCTHCEASFPNAGDLSKHVRSHITNKPFQCSICEKTFTHIGSLNTHIRIHSGEKPYKCELCPKAFTQSSSLMVHVRSHTVRKPHQCNMCDKGFVNYSSLLLHQKTHTKAESYICPECDKEFKQESLLDEHMRMHTQELVYQCSICRTAFRSSSELVQHMKCHMGEKPFTCSLCDRSFTQSGSLNIHMRIHTGEKPFHCKLCDKSFTQASSLSVHMKIHTGEKPYPCHICGKYYSQQAYLNKHIQAHMLEQQQQQQQHHWNMQTAESMKQPETLLCIVCGALHKDATSLALHVTQEHSALLYNLKDATQAYANNGHQSDEERLLQQQEYMQRVHLMLQHMQQSSQASTNALPIVHDQLMHDEIESNDENDANEDELYQEAHSLMEMEVGYEEEVKEEYDDDYAAEEEVQTFSD